MTSLQQEASSSLLVSKKGNAFQAQKWKTILHVLWGQRKSDWVTQLGVTAAYCCPWFCYTCTWVAFLVPYIVERIYWCGGKKGAFCVEPLAVIRPPLLSPLYFSLFISVTSACYQGCGGSWLSCQVLPGIGAISSLKLVANAVVNKAYCNNHCSSFIKQSSPA